MNGFSPPRNPYPGGYDSRPPAPRRAATTPNGRLMVDSFRPNGGNNLGKDAPATNLKNGARPHSSFVDLDDPIQVHLLTETALFDSRRYEILSQEEVDDLKKQCETLKHRIEKTRANLAIQTKYRDAALSMAKLYSPARSSPGRRTPLGSQRSNRDSAEEADLERQATERKCEELASELTGIERRYMEAQRRLLEHTAGILQLTHTASKKQQPQSNMSMMNGMPGSPESLYTYSNDRSSAGPGDDTFLDLQDSLDGMRPRKELADSALKQERDQLKAQADAYGLEIEALRRETSDRERDMVDLERNLESLNSSLRNVIVTFNPTKNSGYRMPPSRGSRPAETIGSQLEYLADSISTVKQEQEQQPSRARGRDTAAEASASVAMAQAEGRIDAINKQVTDLLLSVNATPPPPPNPAGLAGADLELDDRISYLQYSFRVVESELIRAVEGGATSRSRSNSGDERIMRELWDSVQAGLVELQRQREDRRRVRVEKGLDGEEEEMTFDSTFDLSESFSPIGLTIRVQALSSQISKLTEQKCVLKRQIKQQRELNNKSSGEKDIELANKDSEIEQRIIETQNKEIELQGKIAELEAAESVVRTKDAELIELDKKIFDLESQISDLNAQLGEVRSVSNVASSADLESKDAKIRELEAELAEANEILEKSRGDAAQTQGMLLAALRDLDTANKNAETRESESLKSAREELEEKTAKLAALESSSKDLESRLNMTEASRAELQTRMDEIDGRIETLEVELAEATAARKAAEMASEFKQKELDGKQREIKEKDDVLESMNMMVVELKTELTIAKAELDGAYGSRAERAADLAAIKSSDQVTVLNEQIDGLRAELEQTLKQLEDITRETISAEKEKLEAEGRLDDALAGRAALEEEIRELRDKLDAEVAASRDKINKLQEDLDSERLKVPSGEGTGRAGAGASMLSEQFRATMREERKKFQEDMREEQSRRRKLEEELTRLKRAQGPGKSPLSPK